jgi:hypothetical protein
MTPPLPPRINRPRTKSYDDLPAVSALEAAEARLRAAMKLAEDEAKRADEEERKSIILRSELETLKATPTEAKATPTEAVVGTEKPLSISPKGVTVRGKYWKFTIPITLLLSLFPLIWTGVSDYMQLKRDLKTQTEMFSRVVTRVEEVNTYAHEVGNRNAELRETVAELSGYLAGVLPKAGVKVPGAEPGASYVHIVSDPLPVGEMKKRQKPITVRTPVPAPAPR